MGQSKHDVEIGNRQQLGGAIGKPPVACRALALRTMPVPAGVIRDDTMAALIALLHVTAENRRAAIFEGMQNAEMDQVKQLAVFLGKLPSVMTDDIGHLVGWPLRRSPDWRCRCTWWS
jgi:hypothetical protein